MVYAGPIPIARIAPIRKEASLVRWSADRAEVHRFSAATREPTHIEVWYRQFRLTYAVRRGKVQDGCLQIECPALSADSLTWDAMPPRLHLGDVYGRAPIHRLSTPSLTLPGSSSSTSSVSPGSVFRFARR